MFRVTTRGNQICGRVVKGAQSNPARGPYRAVRAFGESRQWANMLSNPIIFEDAHILLRTNDQLRDLTEDVFGPEYCFLDTRKELYDVPSPKLRAECLKTVDVIRNAPENTGRREAVTPVRSLVQLCCGGHSGTLWRAFRNSYQTPYLNYTVGGAWFNIISVHQDGTIMQSDGEKAPCHSGV